MKGVTLVLTAYGIVLGLVGVIGGGAVTAVDGKRKSVLVEIMMGMMMVVVLMVVVRVAGVM